MDKVFNLLEVMTTGSNKPSWVNEKQFTQLSVNVLLVSKLLCNFMTVTSVLYLSITSTLALCLT